MGHLGSVGVNELILKPIKISVTCPSFIPIVLLSLLSNKDREEPAVRHKHRQTQTQGRIHKIAFRKAQIQTHMTDRWKMDDTGNLKQRIQSGITLPRTSAFIAFTDVTSMIIGDLKLIPYVFNSHTRSTYDSIPCLSSPNSFLILCNIPPLAASLQ